MSASSWLAYSWELVDTADSAGQSSPNLEHKCTLGNGRFSRREKFRLNAGPSRTAMIWSKIISILQTISIPYWVRFPGETAQEQRPQKEEKGLGVFQLCGGQGSASVMPTGEVPRQGGVPSHEECPQGNGLHARESVTQGSCHLAGSNTEQSYSGPAEVCGNDLQLKRLKSVEWMSSVVSDTKNLHTFKCPWEKIPDSADPVRGSGYKISAAHSKAKNKALHEHCSVDEDAPFSEDRNGLMGRGERKRSQVENIASVLSSFQLKAGSRVVDFGCGSGALTLPLAALFPELCFIGVDFKKQSVDLLEKRAERASLNNVEAVYGRIETFSEPFDACVALHACGIATDLALLQAVKRGAAYVMSPCCVGKLQIPIRNVMINSARHMCSKPSSRVFFSSGMDHDDNSLIANAVSVDIVTQKASDPGLHEMSETEILRERRVCPSHQESQPEDFTTSFLSYPRSRWLRDCISVGDFHFLARAADWSSYDFEDSMSKLRRLCKIVVELDRNEASREFGYSTDLFSLSDARAGTVGVSHILMGKPHRQNKN